MLNTLCNKFISSSTPENALEIIRFARYNSLFQLGSTFGKYFNDLFPYSYEIKEEYGICLYYINSYYLSYDIFDKALNFKGIDEQTSKRILFNQHFIIDHARNRYTFYNHENIAKILNKEKNPIQLVTLTVTSCKRLDLFIQTVNSVINCLDIDYIDNWVCIDDNSSEEDRAKMMELYPFFIFIFKDIVDKGHPKSMNIIKKYVKTPFIFHLEDDWVFISKRNYISDAFDVLNSNKSLGQCLINKNYAEVEKDIDIKGGEFKLSNNGIRYYIHEHVTSEQQLEKWRKKHGDGLTSNYWPHFSFRPSLIRKEALDKIGEFNENIGHFEMEYAYRYVNSGYFSAFFEGIYCVHTGRLTSERNDQSKNNAYKLNNEEQFIKKTATDIEYKIKTYVLNLDRRPDRWENFTKNAKCIEYLNYERFSAVDGSKLQSTIQLQRIFDCNDYNMMVGAVGCAMSYFKMFTELIYSDYEVFLLLEDDITFVDNFEHKFKNICKTLKNKDWDITFIGHHARNKNIFDCVTEELPILEKYDVYKSFINSLGGTIGFMITKSGARKFLDFVNDNKLINCIDTALQKSADVLNVYYTVPNLVFSECFRHEENKMIDTDIQFNHQSLTKKLQYKIEDELQFFKSNNININKVDNDTLVDIIDKDIKTNSYCITEKIDYLINLCKLHNLKYYTYENSVIFVINDIGDTQFYYHIFKKNGIYNVDDCLIYK